MGTYLALVQIVLMARVPWIDHVVGSDRLMAWHRLTGFATLWLLLGHFVFTTIGWAMSSGRPVVVELLDMLTIWDVLIATVGLVLLAWSPSRASGPRGAACSTRRWYGLHLYAYLGIALAFLHQVTLGTDLIADPVALGYWIGLYVVTFGLLIGYRVVAPIRRLERSIACASPRSCQRLAASSRCTSPAAISTAAGRAPASSSRSAS